MSDDIPLGFLLGILFLLLTLSAFFSGTETALMALNRYKLKHKAQSGHRGARLAEALLRRPDRLITLILFGNNLVNFSASALVSMITLRMGGPLGAAIGTFVFTLVVLIFAEVMPKTLAALQPERLAYPAAYFYYPFQKLVFPLIWTINLFSNGLLRVLGVDPEDINSDHLTLEELRVILSESASMLPRKRHRMLQAILELEEMSVDDVMVPHNDITAIDLDDDWDTIVATIRAATYTRLPVYRDNIDHVVGILNLRKLIHMEGLSNFSADELQRIMDEPYFVPEGTALHRQLIQFQRTKQRTALVVDEFGDIQGLVTLEDILEEIVGEFEADPAANYDDVTRDAQSDGYLVNAGANVRVLNRRMNWNLPVDEAKTLNGLILEQLEEIPATGTDVQLGDYNIEILETSDNAINRVRVRQASPSA